MFKLFLVTLLTSCVMTSSPGLANEALQQQPMPVGYEDPGPMPDQVVRKVVAKLRQELKDPYSMRDLRICNPRAGQAYFASEWRPARWTSMVSVNSKNSYGGYTGATVFNVTFANGEAISMTELRGLSLLGRVENSDLMARARAMAQGCPRISEIEIQQLLEDDGTGSKTERG